jgi:hypothetical protein
MLTNRLEAAQMIAADLRSAEEAIDDAVIALSSLMGTMSKARRIARVNPTLGAPALTKVTEAIARAGEMRQALIDAHHDLHGAQHDAGLGARAMGTSMDKPQGLANDGDTDEVQPIRFVA